MGFEEESNRSVPLTVLAASSRTYTFGELENTFEIEVAQNPKLAKSWTALVLNDEGQKVLKKYNLKSVT